MRIPANATWHVYVVRTRDGSLYTGIATDVARRLTEHGSAAGRGARYLRGRGPLELVYHRKLGDHGLALRVERGIKRKSRADKEAIVAERPSKRALLRRLAVSALAIVVAVFVAGFVPGLVGAGQTARLTPLPTLERLLARAARGEWSALPIGERVARFGLALEGAPYLDGTLEGEGPEVCRVPTNGFDCVTFMELSLCLARVTAPEAGRRARPADVRREVTYTRYRGGRLTDYTSRLHYTSEWIADNVAKGVIEDVTAKLGGEVCSLRVGYMSAHPDRYRALRTRPAWADSMRAIERAVLRTPRVCIPTDRVAAIEPLLRSGDLVAIATSIEGLDYSHTGLIVCDGEGVARFLHASSQHGRVVLDGPLSRYLANGPASATGVTVVRPREVDRGH